MRTTLQRARTEAQRPSRLAAPSYGSVCRRAPLAPSARGFTLIEVTLAVGIFALVMVAINTAFFAALRLRQRTCEVLEESLPINQALAVLRRDLANAVPPGGVMAGNFRSDGPLGITGGNSGSGSSGGSASSKGAASTVLGGQNAGLDFFTTTGTLSDDAPWGDLQEVNYQLMEPTNRADFYGRDLVRNVTRNLLATSTQPAEPRRLLSNVENLEFYYYDGTQWRETWDTFGGDSGLPAAVRVRVHLASPEGRRGPIRQPIEMVVLLTAQGSGTNQTQAAGGSQ